MRISSAVAFFERVAICRSSRSVWVASREILGGFCSCENDCVLSKVVPFGNFVAFGSVCLLLRDAHCFTCALSRFVVIQSVCVAWVFTGIWCFWF